MPLLDIYRNLELDHRFVIGKNETKIGRDISNDLILGGDAVSRIHAVIKCDGGNYILIDKSTNGTLINGKPVKTRRLKDRDVISLDGWRMVYSTQNESKDNRTTQIKKEYEPTPLPYAELNRGWLYHKIRVQIYTPHGLEPRELDLEKHLTRIGSAKDNDIVLDDEYVAHYHGKIIVHDNRILYENLDPVNGSVVDGRSESMVELFNHSIIEIGAISLKVMIDRTADSEDSAGRDFNGIVSGDIKMFKLFDRIETISKIESPVYIYGESGTGKNLVAQAIHDLSGRAGKGKFWAVNCGAIPLNLAESELFGHERGSFTSSVARRIGKFEAANGGTLFLDEIAELDLSVQVKLLQTIQDKEITRVGSNDKIKTDVRIITATNKNLLEEVHKKGFREDLFYRLNVIPLTIPPLRERRGDIPMLMKHFLIKHATDGDTRQFSRRAYAKAIDYDWPGNIRELENMVVRALSYCGNQIIRGDDIEFIDSSSLFPDNSGSNRAYPSWEEIEKRELIKALREHDNNQKAAAKALGLPRTSLISKLAKHGILNKRF